MLYGYAPWTMRSCVPPTTSYCCASSAFGARTTPGINPYRMGRFSRGPVPNASKRQLGSTNLGLPGPLYGKATQGSQRESCLGGWSTGDVLGGLPPENFRGLRGGPAQRQRTEVGRFEVVVKDGRDWMNAAKNVGMWHRGVERGAEALDNAWRRADLSQSNVLRQREASEFV